MVLSCNTQDGSEIDKKPNKFDSLKNNIIGLWGGLGEDSPVLEIRADSIYYFQKSASYLYKLYKDSLVIYFPDHSAVLKDVSVYKDTLIFKDNMDFKTYAYRFKNKSIK
jgi:hypothetical protein